MEIYNRNPNLFMLENGNPTTKSASEGTDVRMAINLLNQYEWSLSTYQELDETSLNNANVLDKAKEQSARLMHSEVSKSDKEKLEPKEYLNAGELTKILDKINLIFDYAPLGSEVGRKILTEEEVKNKGKTRYQGEPITRLYDVAAHHLNLIFTLCPKLQEQHQSEIILGFIKQLSNDHKLNVDLLYNEVYKNRLLVKYPDYADFAKSDDLAKLKPLQDAVDFSDYLKSNYSLKEKSITENINFLFKEGIQDFYDIKDEMAINKNVLVKDFKAILRKNRVVIKDDNIEGDGDSQNNDSHYYDNIAKNRLKIKLSEYLDNQDEKVEAIKAAFAEVSDIDSKVYQYKKLIDLSYDIQLKYYDELKNYLKDNFVFLSKQQKNGIDAKLSSYDDEINDLQSVFADESNDFDTKYKAYLDLTGLMTELDNYIEEQISSIVEFEPLPRSSIKHEDDWNQLDAALDFERGKLHEWLQDTNKNADKDTYIQDMLMTHESYINYAENKLGSADIIYTDYINQYFDPAAENKLSVQIMKAENGNITIKDGAMLEMLAEFKNTQITVWQIVDGDYIPIYQTNEHKNSQAHILCDEDSKIIALAPASPDASDITFAILDYDSNRLKNLLRAQQDASIEHVELVDNKPEDEVNAIELVAPAEQAQPIELDEPSEAMKTDLSIDEADSVKSAESEQHVDRVDTAALGEAKSDELADPAEQAQSMELSGKGLAWYLRLPLVHFQPLPIRTAHDVFHQAAHPVSFFKRFMCPVTLLATFMYVYLTQAVGGFSNPSKA